MSKSDKFIELLVNFEAVTIVCATTKSEVFNKKKEELWDELVEWAQDLDLDEAS